MVPSRERAVPPGIAHLNQLACCSSTGLGGQSGRGRTITTAGSTKASRSDQKLTAALHRASSDDGTSSGACRQQCQMQWRPIQFGHGQKVSTLCKPNFMSNSCNSWVYRPSV